MVVDPSAMLYNYSCDASGTDSTLTGSIGPFDNLDIMQPAGSDASELPIDDPLTPSCGTSELYPGDVEELQLLKKLSQCLAISERLT